MLLSQLHRRKGESLVKESSCSLKGFDIAVDAYEPLVDEGSLILKDEQVLECFKSVLDGVMEMVESQIGEIKRKGGLLKVTTTAGQRVCSF
jgi:hypothetical protein